MLLHYLLKWRNAKIAFSLTCCTSALPEFNQLLDFFNVFDSQLILTLLYDSLSLVINAFTERGYWGHGLGERKLIELQQLDFVARTVSYVLYRMVTLPLTLSDPNHSYFYVLGLPSHVWNG